MPNNPNDLIEKLASVSRLYEKAREAIILLEYYDPKQNAHIGPHNELRNSLDHFMKMIKDRENPNLYAKEFRGAKAHLCRAGYDAYELICMSCIRQIYDVYKSYNTTDISTGFPDYYKIIKPKMQEVKKKTTELRATKDERTTRGEELGFNEEYLEEEEGVFDYYCEAAMELIDFVNLVNEHVESVDECYKERIRETKKTNIKTNTGIVVGIIGIVLAVFAFFFKNT